MRLIDADKLEYQMLYKENFLKGSGHEAQAIWKEDIDSQPTIDAVPVRHGRWIIKSNPENGWYKITCSECGEDETTVAPCIGFMPNVKVIWDFCPNCGAMMDGGGKNAIS